MIPQNTFTPDYSVTPRWVVAAAIEKEGRIIVSARHFDKVMREQINSSEGLAFWRGSSQGFIDQFGDFLTREEAFTIAETNDQIRRETDWKGTLSSENLY